MDSLVWFDESKGGSASSAVTPEDWVGGGVDASDEAEETELLLFSPPRSNDMVLPLLVGSEAVPPSTAMFLSSCGCVCGRVT